MTLHESDFQNLCLFKASPLFHVHHCPRKYLPQHHILHLPDTSGASKSFNFLEITNESFVERIRAKKAAGQQNHR